MSFSSKHNDYLDPDRQFPVFEEPKPDKFVLSPCTINLDSLESEVRKALEKMQDHAMKFAMKWQDLFEGMPKGKFRHDSDEAGDWVYWSGLHSEDWEKIAYTVNVGREKIGTEWVEFLSVDADGEWAHVSYYDSHDIGRRELEFAQDCLLLHPYYTLLRNSLYKIHVARTGEDPLHNTIGRKSPKEMHLRNLGTETLDLCLSVYKVISSDK